MPKKVMKIKTKAGLVVNFDLYDNDMPHNGYIIAPTSNGMSGCVNLFIAKCDIDSLKKIYSKTNISLILDNCNCKFYLKVNKNNKNV
jgi:hypothetical protein